MCVSGRRRGFCPCGPEPSCGYVTETSHPDVELEEVCAGAAQRRDARAAARFYKFGSVCAKSASGLEREPGLCLSTVKLTEQLSQQRCQNSSLVVNVQL